MKQSFTSCCRWIFLEIDWMLKTKPCAAVYHVEIPTNAYKIEFKLASRPSRRGAQDENLHFIAVFFSFLFDR